jgi:hypothetical protein
MKQKLTEAQVEENVEMLEFIFKHTTNGELTGEILQLLKEFESCTKEDERKKIIGRFEKELDRLVGAKTGKFYVPENNN